MIDKKQISVIVYLLEWYSMNYQEMASRIEKIRLHNPYDELIEIELPKYYCEMIHSDIDTYIETNQDEFDNCEEAQTLKDEIGSKLFLEKEPTLEEVEEAIEVAKECLNFYVEQWQEGHENLEEDGNDLDKFIYKMVQTIRGREWNSK